MSTQGTLLSMFVAGMIVCGSAVLASQDYPNRPIRIIAAGPGGGSDFIARFVAQGISDPLGQPVIVENRPTSVTAELASKASPDGYTLVLGNTSFWIAPMLRPASYDPIRDFSPITLTEKSPNVLVVYPGLPVSSVKDLIAYVKPRPGQLNYASSQAGSTGHLAAELFKAMAGVNIVRIGYKASSLAVNDLLTGQVHLAFSNPTSMMPYAKLGKLKALAVTSAQPSALTPGLPTIAASGLPGYEATSTSGMFAPAKTPKAIIDRLNTEIARALGQPDVELKFSNASMGAASSSPAAFAAVIKTEMARFGKVIKDAGIKAD